MPTSFYVIVTPAFERSVRRLTRSQRQLPVVLNELVAILREDPYNRSQAQSIKKLTNVKSGEGQWRIRSGDF